MRAMIAPLMIMLPIAFAGALGLTTWPRRLLFGLLPLFVAAYHVYPIFLFHYVTFALPGLILLYALAPGAVALSLPRYSRVAETATMLLLITLSIAGVVNGARHRVEDPMALERTTIDTFISENIHSPAIVLFTEPGVDEQIHFEPVYNDNVAWPDDAPVVRAHDLGVRNVELFRYYARLGQNRDVWRYDRRSWSLSHVGRVADLAP
jgi:hypothetical protein